MRGLTWFLNPEDIGKNFSLKDVLEFSKKWQARVIIRDAMIINNGGIIWLA